MRTGVSSLQGAVHKVRSIYNRPLWENILFQEKILRMVTPRSIKVINVPSEMAKALLLPSSERDKDEVYRSRKELAQYGAVVKEYGARIYTQINSQYNQCSEMSDNPRKGRAEVAFVSKNYSRVALCHKFIELYFNIFELAHLPKECKIILQVGEMIQTKKWSKKTFAQKFEQLPDDVKARLALQNSFAAYNIRDCLDIFEMCGIPIVLNTAYDCILDSGMEKKDIISAVRDTWTEQPMCFIGSPGKMGNAERTNVRSVMALYPQLFTGNFDLVFTGNYAVDSHALHLKEKRGK